MTPGTALNYEAKRYAVERVEIGTSWLGDSRVIRVDRKRQAARDMDRGAEVTLRKWARRQWRKLSGEWHAVGRVEIVYGEDASDLFIRNQGAYRVTQRAIRIDDDWRASVGESHIDTQAASVEIAVLRGEMPKPPVGCDCDCCEH